MSDKQELVMVEWKKKCIKVLPIIRGMKKILVEFYKREDIKKRRQKANALYLTTGINYIPREYWEECKKHRMVKLDINDQFLVEIECPNEEKDILKQEKEEIKEKEEKIKKEIKNAKDTTTKKTKEKNLDDLKKKEKEIDKKIEELPSDFLLLSLNKKKEVIKNTFDIRSLNKFLEDETKPDIRLLLEKRIDEIQNAKVDETIGHPESHLKTS